MIPTVDSARLPGGTVVNPPDWAPAAVSAHANAVAVSDFMRTVLLRNNIDDRGGVMVSTVNCVVADASPGPSSGSTRSGTGRADGLRPGAAR